MNKIEENMDRCVKVLFSAIALCGSLILIVLYQDGDGKLVQNHPQASLEDATRSLNLVRELFSF